MYKRVEFRNHVPQVVFSLFICGLWSQFAFAIATDFLLDIRRLPELNGQVSYELRTGGAPAQIAHLPNATSLVSTSFATFNSFDALRNAVVGNWTIDIPAMGPPKPQELYTFQISDFPESVLYTVPPTITSPSEGSIVPVDFTMTWEWPPSVSPPGRSTLVNRIGPVPQTSSNSSSLLGSFLSVGVSSRHGNGTIAERVILRAGDFNVNNANTLLAYMSPITPQQAVSSYEFSHRAQLKSYSNPVTVFPVPEPNLLWLTIGAGVLVFGGRPYCKRTSR
jgi:hypothetical protein